MNFYVLVISLILGSLMLSSVCFVYIRHRIFGIGGSFLTIFGTILIGLSVWKTVDIKTEKISIKLRATEDKLIKLEENMTTLEDTFGKFYLNIALQSELKEKGFYKGPISGIITVSYKKAIKEYQKKHNLPVTGVVDYPTFERLNIPLEQKINIRGWEIKPKNGEISLGVKG